MRLATLVKATILFFTFTIYSFSLSAGATASIENPITVGAEQIEKYLPQLKGKNIGLVVNQTSNVFDEHLVDVLLKNNIDIKMIFCAHLIQLVSSHFTQILQSVLLQLDS